MPRGKAMCHPKIVVTEDGRHRLSLYWGQKGRYNLLMCAPVKNREMAIRQLREMSKKLDLQYIEVIYQT